jgi:hypothetical protein
MEQDYFINPQAGGRAKSKTTNTRLTPYQRHLKEFAKTYKGKSLMKAAGAAWTKKQGTTGKKTSRKTSRRRTRSRTGSRKQRGGADHDDHLELDNPNTGYGRDDTAALKQILMQRLYGS